MSSVRFMFPENKLAKLIRAPGGKAAAEAVRDAQANLEALHEEGMATLEAALIDAEAAFAAAPKTYDEALLDTLYRIGAETIGVAGVCGMAPVETVLTSLCDLLEHFKTNKLWDLVAIDVHIRSYRLLLGDGGKTGAGVQAILAGLRRVTERYA